MTSDKLYWVWLSSIPGIGAIRFYKLIERFGSPQNIWEASKDDLRSMANTIGEKYIDQIILNQTPKAEEKAYQTISHPGIRVITLKCAEYPPLLKNIYDPPPVLFLKGQDLRLDNGSIAVVGSRRSSEYGRQTAERIACKLAQAGIAVVSGLARGIDTMVHRGALEATNGYTAAVLGCGVNYVYPPENKWLYQEIEKKGSILSEYPLFTQPAAGNFPARNRIISGLAQGVLVVEAGLKSGALITVDFALEQGRDVYAMPGNISPFSEGTNKLIKEGAKVVTSVDDILEDFGSRFEKLASGPAQPFMALDFFETGVYNALEDGQKDMEELIRVTQMETGRLNAVLTMLEIKGIIKQIPGKIFMIHSKA